MSSTSFSHRPRVQPTRLQAPTRATSAQTNDENAIRGKPAVVDNKARSALGTLATSQTATRQAPAKTAAIPIKRTGLTARTTVSSIVSRPPVVPTFKPVAKIEVLEDPEDVFMESEEEENESMEVDPMDEESDAEKPAKIEKTLHNVEDIDEFDTDDVQFCSEYVNQIFAHFREKEIDEKIDFYYMEKQPDLNAKYRTIMIDWMAEVVVKFGLLSETFFLSVNVVDRFLQLKAVARSRFQLLGIAAMLIASKYEEIYTPKVDDFIYITANAYTREDLLKMEKMVLMTLDFNLNVPSPIHFLRRFSKAAHSDSKVHTLGKYLTELSLLDYELLKYTPSAIAASATYLSRAMTRSKFTSEPLWNDTIEHYTGYAVHEIMPCIESLNELLLKQNADFPYKAIFRKYSSTKVQSVAAIPAIEL